MEIQEYRSKELFRRYQIPVLYGTPVLSKSEIPEKVRDVALRGGGTVVVKAQVLAGGRGKAGGIKVTSSQEEAVREAGAMLGTVLHTPQTGKEGQLIRALYLEEGCQIQHEYYLSFIVNREREKITIMASSEGGVDIEEVAEKTPEKVIYVDIDVLQGMQMFHARQVCYGLGLAKEEMKDFSAVLMKLYRLFHETDASQLEINPFAKVKSAPGGHAFIALDAKLNFDDNALYRHKDLMALRDPEDENPAERDAKEHGLSYVKMDGSIGCMVNGAGLAMATMDIIKFYGEEPANFLDVGGGADKERVKIAFRIILSDPAVKGILINIFGGIVRCDMIAKGVIQAVRDMQLHVPLVVRLMGTHHEEGKKLLNESGLNIVAAETLEDAAQKIVTLVRK